MKIRTILTVAFFAAIGFSGLRAQEVSTQQNFDFIELPEQTWYYVNNDFDGLWFQLPNEVDIVKGSEFRAVSKDGGFAVNMVKVNQPSTMKITTELCKRACDSFGLSRGSVRKIKFKGVKGVRAEGLIDGRKVVIVVLPYEDHQVQIVLMTDPFHTEWVEHFLKTLRK